MTAAWKEATTCRCDSHMKTLSSARHVCRSDRVREGSPLKVSKPTSGGGSPFSMGTFFRRVRSRSCDWTNGSPDRCSTRSRRGLRVCGTIGSSLQTTRVVSPRSNEEWPQNRGKRGAGQGSQKAVAALGTQSSSRALGPGIQAALLHTAAEAISPS